MRLVLEIVLKVVVILIFLSLTLKDFINVIIDFCGDNTITFANATWDNDTIYLQNFTICASLAPLQWWRNANNSSTMANVWSPDLLSTWQESMDLLRQKKLFNLSLESGDNISDFNTGQDALYKNYPQPYDTKLAFAVALVNDVATYFGLAMGLKKNLFEKDVIYENTFAYKYLNASSMSKDYFQAHDWFMSNTEAAHNLELSVFKTLCQQFSPVLAKPKSTTQIDLCDVESVLRYSPHILVSTLACFPIPINLFNIQRDTEQPVFKMDPDSAYVHQIDQTWDYGGYLHVDDSRPILDGSIVYRAANEFRMTNYVNSFVDVKVEATGVFHPLGGSPCIDARSERECLLKCKVQVIVDECGCNPFFYRHLLTNGDLKKRSFCLSNDYQKCVNATYYAYQERCDRLGCRTLCSYTKYSWNFKTTSEQGQVTVYFTSSSFFYVDFQQLRKTSVSELVSQIGGIVGLYLGVSGLTVCTFVMLMFKTMEVSKEAKKRAMPQIDDENKRNKTQMVLKLWAAATTEKNEKPDTLASMAVSPNLEGYLEKGVTARLALLEKKVDTLSSKSDPFKVEEIDAKNICKRSDLENRLKNMEARMVRMLKQLENMQSPGQLIENEMFDEEKNVVAKL